MGESRLLRSNRLAEPIAQKQFPPVGLGLGQQGQLECCFGVALISRGRSAICWGLWRAEKDSVDEITAMRDAPIHLGGIGSGVRGP